GGRLRKRQRGFVMKRIVAGVAALCVAGAAAVVLAEEGSGVPSPTDVERGRYLVRIGGCNDCHTPGYPAAGGDVPEEHWLVGDTVGYSGPWGTTYAANLRHLLGAMSEDDWV